MLNYFLYVQQNIIKRKSIWVSIGLYWLYLSLILLFVPWFVNLPSTALWNNTVFDLQSFSILLLSICCSITAVVIFREGRDDGSELIILSKSISRTKIILVKFISFLLTMFITTVVSMLIMLGLLFFGKYDIVKNPDGVVYKDLLTMEAGLFLATIVISLFFGAIAILISTIASKVIIMISTIGTAIVFNIIYMLVPILTVTPNDYIKDKYSVNLVSNRYMGIDGTMYDVVASDHIHRDDDPEKNYDTLRYVNDGVTHSTGALVAYLNIAQQLTSLFHTFDSSNDNLEHSSFGQQFTRKYWISQDHSIFDNPAANSRPWIEYVIETTQGMPQVSWNVFGCNLDLLDLYSLSNATADSFLYVRPFDSDLRSYASTSFYSMSDLTKFPSEDAKEKTMAYVRDLEEEGFGYYKNETIEQLGEKTDLDLRERFAKDLFEDSGSAIYYDNSDFPLPYRVEKNNSAYDKSMDADFLTLWFLIVQDIENEIWNRMDKALANYEVDPNGDSLPPFDKWKDEEIHNRLDKPTTPRLKGIYDVNDLKRYKWDLWNNGHSFYAFSTTNTKVDNQTYVNSDYQFIEMYHHYDTSDVFSSLYAYEQEPYYDGTGLTIFWSCFALILFAATAIVYARTDIK